MRTLEATWVVHWEALGETRSPSMEERLESDERRCHSSTCSSGDEAEAEADGGGKGGWG